MAFLSDVLRALKTQIVAATENLGVPPRPRTVMLGHPARNQMRELLQKGQTIITVFAPQLREENVTRYAPTPYRVTPFSNNIWINDADTRCIIQSLISGDPAISFTIGAVTPAPLVAGEVVTLTLTSGNIVLVPDDTYTIHHTVVAGDTLDIITADLASQLNALAITGVTAAAVANVLTLTYAAGNTPVSFRTSLHAYGVAVFIQDLQRLRRWLHVEIYAPSPFLRDLFGNALDSYFTLFTLDADDTCVNALMLPDGSTAQMFYIDSWYSDDEQYQKDFYRCFQVSAEYSTTRVVAMTPISGINIDFTANPDQPTPGGLPVPPPYCGLSGTPSVEGITGCVTPMVASILETLTVQGNAEDECVEI